MFKIEKDTFVCMTCAEVFKREEIKENKIPFEMSIIATRDRNVKCPSCGSNKIAYITNYRSVFYD